MQQPGIEERFHHHGYTADAIEVDHVKTAVRFHVGQVGHSFADPVEILEGELDLRLVGYSKQMQHCVSGAAERHHDRYGVFEGLLGHDLAGT